MEFSILFKNLSTLTVVKYTQQKTYHVNHFEVCSSVGLLLLLSRFSHVRLCDPMDCSPPGFSVAGILQVRYSYVVWPLLSSISRTFFFILQNWNSVPINQLLYSSFYLSPWQSHSTFCLYEFDCSKYLIQCLSFCDWLFWLIIIYSRLIHVVACVRIFFF